MTKFNIKLIIIWKEDSIYFSIFICERNVFATHCTVGHCCRRKEREVSMYVYVVKVLGKRAVKYNYTVVCVHSPMTLGWKPLLVHFLK